MIKKIKNKLNKLKKQKYKILFMLTIYLLVCFLFYTLLDNEYQVYKTAKQEVEYYNEYKENHDMSFQDFKKYKEYEKILKSNDEKTIINKRQKNRIIYKIVVVLMFFILIFH